MCHQNAATLIHIPLERQSPGSDIHKVGTIKIYFNGKKRSVHSELRKDTLIPL